MCKTVLKGKLKGFTLRSETIEDLCENFSTITKTSTKFQKTRARSIGFKPSTDSGRETAILALDKL